MSFVTTQIWLQANGKYTKIFIGANDKAIKEKDLSLEQLSCSNFDNETMKKEVLKNTNCKVINIEFAEHSTRCGWRGAQIPTKKRVKMRISDWELYLYKNKSDFKIVSAPR
jgi:hypothetical protein